MTDFTDTSFIDTDETATVAAPAAEAHVDARVRWPVRMGRAFVVAALVFAGGGLLGWAGWHEGWRQRRELRWVRAAVEQALAPGEVVVVDDWPLAWALRRGRTGVLRQSVWTVSEDVPVSSLLRQMESSGRREIVVVATPDDRLIQHLDAAGFSVAQEVGWVPWDPKGDGRALLGRGKMRIYFAVSPAGEEPAKRHGVLSELK